MTNALSKKEEVDNSNMLMESKLSSSKGRHGVSHLLTMEEKWGASKKEKLTNLPTMLIVLSSC